MSVADIGMINVTELELLTHPEYLNSLPVFSGVRVVQSIVICLVFCWGGGGGHCFSFQNFFFGLYFPTGKAFLPWKLNFPTLLKNKMAK